ncbi:hypothetical protein [Streptomyces gibsoniae]|uniref:Uncharacterized protein n=1 Tax=Streptomyces gibsoniae TaxID=3075529 RepID=A0ABU2U8X1_9ACTN|nr:hypothetical protein [Streptomyces sp. DSM 41699]MDT0469687.1 hypothetical protein [Streptomyces sp. DSM 41699]
MGFFSAEGAPDELPQDPPPRRPVDNRRARRDRQFGRSYLARCLWRGTSLPWHARRWPPVRHFDVVPILRLRRERGAQSARWAAGVVIVSLPGTPEEQWTVAVGGVGLDSHDGAEYLRLVDPIRQEAERQRRAEAARATLRSRIRLAVQPTHAP